MKEEKMKYKIADSMVEFEPKFEMLETRANAYKIEDKANIDWQIMISEEKIQERKDKEPEITLDLAEYILTGWEFYKGLLKNKGYFLHASCVVIDDEAYLFSADSGTGKSTHTGLWLKYLAEKKPYILNDDKPAIRVLKDGIYAYGTPFSGKYDMSVNQKVKVKAICFLERAEENRIRRVEPKEAIRLFLEQILIRLKEEEMLQFLEIVDCILKEIPIYKLYCDMSEEAVRLSYQTMKGVTNEN